MGLPMYITMDHKPENGCEIQNSACGRSGIMLHLKLVKSANEQQWHREATNEDILQGTAVMKELIFPWKGSKCVVCGDSYFASVAAAEELLNIGLRFIGVVKTATKTFPMSYLSNEELTDRGQYKGVVTLKMTAP